MRVHGNWTLMHRCVHCKTENQANQEDYEDSESECLNDEIKLKIVNIRLLKLRYKTYFYVYELLIR